MSVIHRATSEWSLLTARLDLEGGSGRAEIDRVAYDIYKAVTFRMAIGSERVCSPVRFWNFIPEIHAPYGDGIDLYRAFNIGRHSALMDMYGSAEAFVRLLPTATGVGHDGCELVVHCLATTGVSVGLENPRQQPAYSYSRRFGPVAPSFARATIVQSENGERELFVGGTSSVRGEESVHSGDLEAQLEETLANLSVLISRAFGVVDNALLPVDAEPLARLESVRVYCVRQRDIDVLSQRLGEVLLNVDEIEFIRADICRSELLVEIEGVAPLDRLPSLSSGATG